MKDPYSTLEEYVKLLPAYFNKLKDMDASFEMIGLSKVGEHIGGVAYQLELIHNGMQREIERFRAPTLAAGPHICVWCETPITGTMYGAGDGTGQRFACERCHLSPPV